MTSLTAENVRFGHVSEDTALVIDDYPYGYTLRTQIRYWIETTKNGDRFCSQTLNPKTDRWNKPKKSTYCEVGVLFIEDETGHVKWAGLSVHAKDEYLAHFLAVTEGKLSEAQLKKVARVIGLKKAFEGVEWSIRPTTGLSQEERDQLDADQENAHRVIAQRAAVATAQAAQDLGVQA